MGHLVVSPPSEMITSCGEMYCYMMIWSIHRFYHQYCYKNHAVSKMDTRSHKKKWILNIHSMRKFRFAVCHIYSRSSSLF
jgi:hypothetical protein